MYLKPANGMLVKTEDAARYVEMSGEDLPDTSYYRRRVRDGDLVKAHPPKPAKEK